MGGGPVLGKAKQTGIADCQARPRVASSIELPRPVHHWPRPPSQADIIQIWLSPALSDPRIEVLVQHLDPAEQNRALRFRRASDRRHFIGSHLLLRGALAVNLECGPSEISFSFGPHGKPELAHRCDQIQFSLSRSHEFALLAVWTRNRDCPPLGVDLERQVACRADDAIVRQQFSEAEQRFVRNARDREKAFFQIWTGKEAYIKGLGRGLSHPLPKFDVSPHPHKTSWPVEDWSADRPQRTWFLQNVPLPIGEYVAALATPAKSTSYELIPISNLDLAGW